MTKPIEIKAALRDMNIRVDPGPRPGVVFGMMLSEFIAFNPSMADKRAEIAQALTNGEEYRFSLDGRDFTISKPFESAG